MSKARLHAAIRKCYSEPEHGVYDTTNNAGAEDQWRSTVRKSVVAKVCDFGAAFLDRLPEEGPPTRNAHSACGSRSYCDPEVYRIMAFQSMATQAARVWDNSQGQWQEIVDTGYDPYSADVWSYGVVVFTLVTGSKPFHAPCIADNVFRAFLRATQPEVMHDEICAPWCERWLEDCLPGSSGQLKPGLDAWKWPATMSLELVDLLGKCLRLRSAERISMAEVLQHPWMTSPLSKSPLNQPKRSVGTATPTIATGSAAARPRGASTASGTPSSASMVSVKREMQPAAHTDSKLTPAQAHVETLMRPLQSGAADGALAVVHLQPSTSEEGVRAEAGFSPQHTHLGPASPTNQAFLGTMEHTISAAIGRITAVKLQQDADELETHLREAGELRPVETRPDLMASMCTPVADTNTVSLSIARSNSGMNPVSPACTSANDRNGGTVWKFSFPTPGTEQGTAAEQTPTSRLRINTGATTRPSRRFSGSQQRAGERSYVVSAFEQPLIPSALLSPHTHTTPKSQPGASASGLPQRFSFSKSASRSLEPSQPAGAASRQYPPGAAPAAQPSGAESCASSDVAGEAGDVLSPLVAKLRLPAVAPQAAVVAGGPLGGGPKPLASLKPGEGMLRTGSSSSTGHAPPFRMRGNGSLDLAQHPRLDPSNSGTATPSMLRQGSSGVNTGS